MNEFKALSKSVEVLGGQTATANELNKRMKLDRPLTQAHVYKWLNSGRCLPAKYAAHMEAATKEKGKRFMRGSFAPSRFPKLLRGAHGTQFKASNKTLNRLKPASRA